MCFFRGTDPRCDSHEGNEVPDVERLIKQNSRPCGVSFVAVRKNNLMDWITTGNTNCDTGRFLDFRAIDFTFSYRSIESLKLTISCRAKTCG